MSATEFRLLRALLRRPGRVFSREQLMTAAWEDPGAALERTVETHIKSLRANPATGRKSSGLGLCFVREAAELHGGATAVANRTDAAGVRAILRLAVREDEK